MVIQGIVWGGYGLAGIYGIKTGIKYFQDYKESVENERLGVK